MIGIYACVDFMRLENITNPMLTDSQIGYLWIQNSGLEQQASQEPDQPFAWAGWGVDGIPQTGDIMFWNNDGSSMRTIAYDHGSLATYEIESLS